MDNTKWDSLCGNSRSLNTAEILHFLLLGLIVASRLLFPIGLVAEIVYLERKHKNIEYT